MKILVTEQQLRFIKEVMEQTSLELKGKTIASKYAPPVNFGQSKGDSSLKQGKVNPITVKKPGDFSNLPDMSGDPHHPKYHAQTSVDVDTMVSIFSAVLDGIPGVGNLASFAIDEIHAITYLIRAIFTTGNERTENLILAVMTAALGLYPIGGNVTMLATRQGIKTILKQTPDSIQKWAIKNGIINYRILFGKGIFKYSIILLLVRIFKDQTAETITENIDKIEESFVKAKSAINQKGLGLLSAGLTPILLMGLNKAFDAVISNLNEISLEEIKVAKQMIDKGFI